MPLDELVLFMTVISCQLFSVRSGLGYCCASWSQQNPSKPQQKLSIEISFWHLKLKISKIEWSSDFCFYPDGWFQHPVKLPRMLRLLTDHPSSNKPKVLLILSPKCLSYMFIVSHLNNPSLRLMLTLVGNCGKSFLKELCAPVLIVLSPLSTVAA